MRIQDSESIDKWGYAIFAGMIGLAAASSPGGISPSAGFGLGFLAAYLGLMILEIRMQVVRSRREYAVHLKLSHLEANNELEPIQVSFSGLPEVSLKQIQESIEHLSGSEAERVRRAYLELHWLLKLLNKQTEEHQQKRDEDERASVNG